MTIRNSGDDAYGVRQSQIPSYQAQGVVIDEDNAPMIHIDDEDFAEPVFRDVFWAVLFIVHLLVMIYLGIAYGSFGVDTSVGGNSTSWKEEMEKGTDDDQAAKAVQQMENFVEAAESFIQVYPQRILFIIVIPCAILAFCFSYVGTAFAIPSCPTTVVQFALLGSIGWTVIITLSGAIASHSFFGYLMAAGMIGIVIYYVRIVWSLIPFAAVNLKVSLEGISTNWGMYIVAILFSAISFLWTVFWLYVTIGVLGYESSETSDEAPKKATDDDYDYSDGASGGLQGFIFFLLLFSLYWTSTVLMVSKLEMFLQERCLLFTSHLVMFFVLLC